MTQEIVKISRKIKPIKKNLLIEMIESEEGVNGISDSKCSIILPQNLNKNRLVRAKVIAVGEEVDPEIKAGDTVICRLLSGIQIYGQNLVHEEIVYCKVEK